MNKDHYDEFAKYMHYEVCKTRNAGQEEYATENNVFADFESTAKLSGITPEIVIYIFLNKHIRGIGAFIRGRSSQREDVTGRIKDAIVYLFLLWAMIDGEKQLDAIKEPNRVRQVESML